MSETGGSSHRPGSSSERPPGAASERPAGGAPRGVSTLAFVLGGLGTLLCGSGLALPFVADAMATSMAASHLAAHGLVCEGLSLDVSYDLARAEVAPTRCTRTTDDDVDVEALELVDPAFVDLVLFEPTHARMGRVRVHLRADDPGTGVDLGALGPVASILRIPSRIASATRAAAEVARHGLPPAEVSTAEIVRGENVRVTMTDVTIGGGSPMTFTIASMSLPALEGPFGTNASVSIFEVTGDATASSCTVRGDLQIDASIPLVGDVHRRPAVTIAATALDGPSPDWTVSFDGGT